MPLFFACCCFTYKIVLIASLEQRENPASPVKIMYQELLTDEVNVDYLLVAVKQINDKFKIELSDRKFITNEHKKCGLVSLNEIFKYEVPGVCDARIWYELIITKEKIKKFNYYDFRNNEF